MAVQTAKIQNLGGSQILYNDLRKRAASADGNLADEYSASKTYAVGDYVVYLDKLYRCKTAITTAEAWTAAHWEETSMGEETSALKSAIVTKAEEDGYYEELTAGSAEQLVSTEAVTDTTPYLYRKSGGSVDIGNRATLDKIVGGTVAWNQLVQNGNFDDASNWHSYGVASLNVSSNEATITWTGSGNASFRQGISPSLIPTHKYIISADMKGNSTRQTFMQVGNIYKTFSVTDNYKSYVRIIEPSSLASGSSIFIGYITGESGDTLIMRKTNLFDLTAMFGPTIADYIYNLEQTTAGAGVAWFRKLFPKDYYPYNPGELISVKTTSHDMVGFNLWDEEWRNGFYDSSTGIFSANANYVANNTPIHVLPETVYYFNIPLGKEWVAFWYDANMKFISRSGMYAINPAMLTSPARSEYVNFYLNASYGTTYNHDICINLSHSGSRNGEYEPYEKHSYPLADVELRGPLAIDENGKLVYSGDEYPPSGQVARKYKLVNLGTLNWSTAGASSQLYSAQIPSQAKANGKSICAKLTYRSDLQAANLLESGEYLFNSGKIYAHNSGYTSVADFKAAMTNVYAIYETETIETEQVAPYTPVQVVDDWGIEEFVDIREVPIPVGHSTSYMANLRDKLQHLPSLADEDGEYIVKQTGTKMELSKLSSSGLAQSIYESIESTPVASFKDGADGQAMKAVNVAIEPVQDLHGYDSPWPAGGGKNKFNPEEALNSKWIDSSEGNVPRIVDVGGYWITGYIPVKTGDIVRFPNKGSSRCGWFNTDKTGYQFFSASVMTNGIASPIDGYVVLTVDSTIPFGGEFIVTINDADLTYAPYSNICPISGWTGATVTRTGKNLLPITAYKNFSYNPQIGTNFSPMSADHSYVDNGGGTFVCSATASWEQCGLLIPVPVAGTYYLSIQIDGAPTVSINRLNTEYVVVSDATYLANPLPASATITKTEVVAEPGYILIYIASHGTEIKITNPICQYEEPITTYVPYSSNTYSITFPTEAGTVYGGTLDVASGVLTVDRKIVNLESLIWLDTSTELYERAYSTGVANTIKKPGTALEVALALSEQYEIKARAYVTNPGTGLAVETNGTLFVQGSKSPQGNFVYELATPFEYALTPQEIKTLLGINNVWSDAGNTAITYPADTKLYIDNKIAELQALILENNG